MTAPDVTALREPLAEAKPLDVCPKCERGLMKPNYIPQPRYECRFNYDERIDGKCPDGAHLHVFCQTCHYERVEDATP